MKTPKILFNPITKAEIDIVIKDKTNCALIGERGAGKTYICEYIAEKIFGHPISKNPFFIVVNAEKSGIDEVRILQKKLSLIVPGKTQTKRIVVIEHFNNFGHEAQNALLKTFEEPPSDTLIMITIDKQAQVLDTIYSRLRTVHIKPVSLEDATEFYENSVSSQDLEKAFHISSGSVGLLHSLLTLDDQHELVKAISKSKELLSLPKYKRIALIDSVIKNSTLPVSIFLDGLLRLLEAANKHSLASSNSSDNVKLSIARVKHALNAVQDIESGVSQKLVLTRLFLVL